MTYSNGPMGEGGLTVGTNGRDNHARPEPNAIRPHAEVALVSGESRNDAITSEFKKGGAYTQTSKSG